MKINKSIWKYTFIRQSSFLSKSLSESGNTENRAQESLFKVYGNYHILPKYYIISERFEAFRSNNTISVVIFFNSSEINIRLLQNDTESIVSISITACGFFINVELFPNPFRYYFNPFLARNRLIINRKWNCHVVQNSIQGEWSFLRFPQSPFEALSFVSSNSLKFDDGTGLFDCWFQRRMGGRFPAN